MLLAFELQSLFCFCIRAAEASAALVLVVVLLQCKSAKDSCSLHTLRACCCFAHSYLHRGRHYHQQGCSGRHDYPSTMSVSHRYVPRSEEMVHLQQRRALTSCAHNSQKRILNPADHRCSYYSDDRE